MMTLDEVLRLFPDLTSSGWGGRRSEKPSRDDFDACVRWLRSGESKESLWRGGSYIAKHEAERWAKRYVSNGAMIAAAIAEGYEIEERFGLNCRFRCRHSCPDVRESGPSGS